MEFYKKQKELSAFVEYINSDYADVRKAEWMTNWQFINTLPTSIFGILRNYQKYRLSLERIKYNHTARWNLPGKWRSQRSPNDNLVAILAVLNGNCPFDSWEFMANHIYEITRMETEIG